MSATCWITLEGLEGVGKTHLAHAVAPLVGPGCVVLGELTDQDGGLPRRVITALSQAGDVFLRTGHPLAETFALLALKIREHERLRTAAPIAAQVVIEDRGVDTVAVYQAVILAPDAPPDRQFALAQRIHATAAHWRPRPELTVLLIDKFDRCAARFAQRIGRPLRADELDLMRRAEQLYTLFAAAEPDRFVVLDRRHATEQQILDQLRRIVADHADATTNPTGLPCAR